MKLIVTSTKNSASKNMHQIFVQGCGFKKTGEEYDGNPIYQKDDFLLIQTNTSILALEPLNDVFSPDIYIVASTHTSESGQKTLTAHVPGNWGDAQFGGNPKELPVAPAIYIKNVITYFHQHGKEGYAVSYEATHHGPSKMNAPICYVEVGGSEVEWNDMAAIRIACKAMLHSKMEDDTRTAVGFGGPHYAPNFSKDYVLETAAIGHICPKHQMDGLTEDMFLSAFAQTFPTASQAILDWKGLSAEQRTMIINLCDTHKIDWKKVRTLKNN